ncbi:hypothetical protein GCM10007304_18010 [Rhodococcoides trifolii]|uniref:Uncharacterized protein n=1 Tax=Rhodococcoides trifolii TaxID=908250 RepID=A0A917D090_9NOCA|nr:hypothetical protein [Rhodococcus trifolii]GGG04284.1 hypothetical protein GCM10007304_18010 [Rhodococcus trifolii]
MSDVLGNVTCTTCGHPAHPHPFRHPITVAGPNSAIDAIGRTDPKSALHPATQHLIDLFEYQHLPPHLQEVSKQLAEVAAYMSGALGSGPELTTGLRKLLEAKDCFVRQAVIDARTRP